MNTFYTSSLACAYWVDFAFYSLYKMFIFSVLIIMKMKIIQILHPYKKELPRVRARVSLCF